ncbi:hypothetical protein H5410_006918 [Solanum commersonii]|uniref:Uncharacterized protein n=1 Tax=Solanum commersonii TaxID=4109 RepID=A0A9J6ABK5_SOLCO|nr:hypothetical protein H5410_006918 [Solanum commersonii]
MPSRSLTQLEGHEWRIVTGFDPKHVVESQPLIEATSAIRMTRPVGSRLTHRSKRRCAPPG